MAKNRRPRSQSSKTKSNRNGQARKPTSKRAIRQRAGKRVPPRRTGLEIYLSGTTEAEVRDEQHLIDSGIEVPRQCYLCKRQHGSKVLSQVQPKSGLRAPYTTEQTLRVGLIERQFGTLTFNYFTCFECALLLGCEDDWYSPHEDDPPSDDDEPKEPEPAPPQLTAPTA